MDIDAVEAEVTGQFRRAPILDDLGMISHDPDMSTKRANDKHELSLDAQTWSRQLPKMDIAARIAAARSAAGLSQAEIGRRVGASQTTISSWERGRTEPTREDVQRIANALGVSIAELELGEGTAYVPNRRTVPLVGYVGAGAVAHYYGSGDGELDRIEAPEGSTDKTVAAEVRGESLGPLLEHWLVFWDDARSPVTADLLGQLCVVALPDDRVLVKQIRPSATPGRFHLISNADAPMFDQEVVWAARVKAMMPR